MNIVKLVEHQLAVCVSYSMLSIYNLHCVESAIKLNQPTKPYLHKMNGNVVPFSYLI